MVVVGINSQGHLRLRLWVARMAASDIATLAFLKAGFMSGFQLSLLCLGPLPFVASVSGLRMLAAP